MTPALRVEDMKDGEALPTFAQSPQARRTAGISASSQDEACGGGEELGTSAGAMQTVRSARHLLKAQIGRAHV